MARTVLLDTNVFVHVLGRDDALRESCAAVLLAVADQRLDAVVSVETVQELLHVRHRKTGDLNDAVELARSVSEAYRLIAVLKTDVTDALGFAAANAGISARDAFILAGAINAGIRTIVTTDRAFAGVDGVDCVDPANPAAVRALIG